MRGLAAPGPRCALPPLRASGLGCARRRADAHGPVSYATLTSRRQGAVRLFRQRCGNRVEVFRLFKVLRRIRAGREDYMKLRAVQVVVVLVSCTFLVGCDLLPEPSPQRIVADGETYVACHGSVWVTLEGGGLFSGGGTFKLTYTDQDLSTHVLRGLKKVETSNLAESYCVPPRPQ